MLLFEPVGIICTKLAIADEAFAALLVEAAKKATDTLQPYELDKLFEWEKVAGNIRAELERARAHEKYCEEDTPPDAPYCRFRDRRTRACLLP